MSEPIGDLTARMRDIFRLVVEAYLDRGQPVGSKAIASAVSLSPASIRGVMQELEELGLLTHPHTSAGRIPTETGLRLFVDGIMHNAMPPARERAAIEAQLKDRSIEEALSAATATLSGLSACAGVVLAPKTEMRLRQLSFVPLAVDRALAVLVSMDGSVENRVVPLPPGTSPMALAEVGNFVSARLSGLTLTEAEARLRAEIVQRREAIDAAAAELVARGLADWSEDHAQRPVLIVRGQANLIDDSAVADLERVRRLLDELEDRQDIVRLLEGAREGQGCRIFIGSENRMFALSGSSVIAAPYRGSEGQVVGVVGVIGPTRLNYARVVPMVDFTAQALTRFMR
ncbi:heat-inducible transcriptional repressor HrcA [Sphingomonas sp. NSE70-1]|uniref:Heat-inducible transcription repressor HrcA n=1 Tax=Sphingomonas caseinilyticus TaxID=2908205 RepID=A0ABT0RSI5_9SPHN|nr:heat-inducible transcriptional repressor HrcA [Sphingomonas caseinilyticus]MCL6697960.1 heat-inducible transcriptional repressor HrcA [Sphingomonas caseinilyticus]